MAELRTTSDYTPTGDQPQAIEKLADAILAGERYQTLVGATGTGKTATMAWTIEKTGRPALVIAHNKTLAAQLCNEFREFFPHNAVEYFVSYYDFYQPEASRRPTSTSRRTPRGTTTSPGSGSPRPRRCSRAATSSWSRPSPASTGSARRRSGASG
jgi:hypothetical protein